LIGDTIPHISVNCEWQFAAMKDTKLTCTTGAMAAFKNEASGAINLAWSGNTAGDTASSRLAGTNGCLFFSRAVGTAVDIAPGADALTLDFSNDPYCPTAITDGEGIPGLPRNYASNTDGDPTTINLADESNLAVNNTTGSRYRSLRCMRAMSGVLRWL
jgi:hypothetical protein